MIGNIDRINGFDLLTLDEIEGYSFTICLNTKISAGFDESGQTNNYQYSSLKEETEKWLRESGIKTLPRELDLTTLDGYQYSTIEVDAAPLTFDEWRKYNHIIKEHIDFSYWLSTAYSNPILTKDVCYINTNNTLTWNLTRYKGLLVPALILDRIDLSNIPTDNLLAEIENRLKGK